MKDMYEVGRVYIWNSLPHLDPRLWNKETTITGHAFGEYCLTHQEVHIYQPTDTESPDEPDTYYVAGIGELRPKDVPSGEQSIKDLVSNKTRLKLPEEESA